MTQEEARAAIGQKVDSCDAGDKMIRRQTTWHGPYILEAVTKDGMCVLDNHQRVPPSLLRLHVDAIALESQSAEADLSQFKSRLPQDDDPLD